MDIKQINRDLGNADLFLIDLILKGYFTGGSTVLDAGCGEGRNLPFFLKNNYNVYGVDKSYSALMMLKIAGQSMSGNFNPGNFINGDLKNSHFSDEFFDYILCFSVLHFAENSFEFNEICKNLTRVLKKNGQLIIGMNSVFGMEKELKHMGDGKYLLPGGETRFLLKQELINFIIGEYEFVMISPLKTHLVHQNESNSYLILKKTG
jgi:tellurite methyltransferase